MCIRDSNDTVESVEIVEVEENNEVAGTYICIYDNENFWRYSSNFSNQALANWSNVFSHNTSGIFSVDFEGYNYAVGTFQENSGGFNVHQICRTPLL